MDLAQHISSTLPCTSVSSAAKVLRAANHSWASFLEMMTRKLDKSLVKFSPSAFDDRLEYWRRILIKFLGLPFAGDFFDRQ